MIIQEAHPLMVLIDKRYIRINYSNIKVLYLPVKSCLFLLLNHINLTKPIGLSTKIKNKNSHKLQHTELQNIMLSTLDYDKFVYKYFMYDSATHFIEFCCFHQ